MDIVERVSPPPRLEMFARRQRLGWDTWGDEALNHVVLSERGRKAGKPLDVEDSSEPRSESVDVELAS
jgi:N6-adenosine-specific RNA methylase IME4